MSKIGIFYGSSTGTTQSVAESIATKLLGHEVVLHDVSKAKASDLDTFNNLIFGTSTWGMGDLQDDWDTFLPNVQASNLNGKTIALFGVGDSGSFSDTFVDGIGIIYEAIKDKECQVVGQTRIEGYSFSDSRALHNGSFVGLPLDESNESDLTDTRIDQWISSIAPFFS